MAHGAACLARLSAGSPPLDLPTGAVAQPPYTPALFLPLVATTAALFTWGLPHRCATLEPAEHNQLALRETAATLLYRLQGRL